MDAPGRPGIAPTWSSSAKDVVTTALGPGRLWVTLGRGIVNEVYYPSTGEPQIRDLGFLLARDHDGDGDGNGDGAWLELKRVDRYRLTQPAPDVPLPTIVHHGDDYALTLEIVPDPVRDVLLVRYALEGAEAGWRVYPLLAPHLGPSARENTAWLERGLLCARGSGGDRCCCLLADGGFARASAGFVGVSDGWQDFRRNGRMTWTYDRAASGSVALIGELAAASGVLALAFAGSAEGAETRARASAAEGFAAARTRFENEWRAWGERLRLPAAPRVADELAREARLSATVLKVHEDKSHPGAVTASLSIPWGASRDDLGGYHLVWTRDAVEAGLGLVAAGQLEDARRMLAYLAATQRPDGHWTQNFFPDGRPYWQGVQLDEVGFPILLAAKLSELGAPGAPGAHGAMPGAGAMVRRAAGYIARQGPSSPQDRWEENAGVSPFTLGVEVAALVAAAGLLDGDERSYVLSLADYWNARIEDWTYVRATELARTHGVDGHYVRLAPSLAAGGEGLRGRLELRNRGGETVGVDALVSLDFLYLARLGLRRADDRAMRDSLVVAEALLGVDTPAGRSYHRYNGDGYGEHEDGRPFDGSGIGRAWPLLTGERGHFALLAGEDPTPYLVAMARMAGRGGLIPEQVWDAPPIPGCGLEPGRPTGSAMPLVWAHAEFVKLLHAMHTGAPLERLAAVAARYDGVRPEARTWHWRGTAPFDALPRGCDLLVEHDEPFTLHLGTGEWRDVEDLPAAALGLGMHGVRLPAERLAARGEVRFTRRFTASGRWEGVDHVVRVGEAEHVG